MKKTINILKKPQIQVMKPVFKEAKTFDKCRIIWYDRKCRSKERNVNHE